MAAVFHIRRRPVKNRHKTDEERKLLVVAVDKLRTENSLTIKAACKAEGISDVSYYVWKKKLDITSPIHKKVSQNTETVAEQRLGPTVPTKIKPEDQPRILEIKAMFPHMGVKQLRQHLIRNHKLIYSERQIRQFFEQQGVPKLKTAYPPQPIRRFERDLPNEMWQVDIMNFHVGQTPLYLISFLDDHSRFIISFSVVRQQTSQALMELLKRALSFRKPLSILSDRGIQFSSWNGVTAFQLELRAHHIDHLLAREQHPETCGKIEAFHKTIKRELLTTTEFSDIDEAKERIHDYVMFYNFSRPHMGIDNQAPAERYFKHLTVYNHRSVYHRKTVPHPSRRRDRYPEKEAKRETQKALFEHHSGTGTANQGTGKKEHITEGVDRNHFRGQSDPVRGRSRKKIALDNQFPA